MRISISPYPLIRERRLHDTLAVPCFLIMVSNARIAFRGDFAFRGVINVRLFAAGRQVSSSTVCRHQS